MVVCMVGPSEHSVRDACKELYYGVEVEVVTVEGGLR